ncbi:hypothetical protein EX30DRAFT_340197 [Ascodesmis nigricans]|uniref:Uncharacterized protein n=1 Tax=Ascodesmis nigricans TaxID=341454 RepID=A0A4S2MZT2_9PEZI|nr:hypothetical protein EX30DRAFT_340197 [Ascodesmis nigricans]
MITTSTFLPLLLLPLLLTPVAAAPISLTIHLRVSLHRPSSFSSSSACLSPLSCNPTSSPPPPPLDFGDPWFNYRDDFPVSFSLRLPLPRPPRFPPLSPRVPLLQSQPQPVSGGLTQQHPPPDPDYPWTTRTSTQSQSQRTFKLRTTRGQHHDHHRQPWDGDGDGKPQFGGGARRTPTDERGSELETGFESRS